MDAEQASLRVGSVVDGRTIEHLIGIGGMAAVYSAGGIALKILHPEQARSQRALDRFRREEEVLQMALHPAVPRVHGSGTTDDGAPYLAMDLILGETVEARRRRFGGRLPWAEVVAIANVVLDVLEAAHARGVLHRDIKPSNVLWLDDGSIRVIDFGIALAERDEDARTKTGELPGSLPFMSPEHALGVPGEIDERSDLWSLGATMFLLLSGRPVHESPTDIGALALSASKPARSLGAVVRELPPALVSAVDRALAFDPKKRFADARSMKAALGGSPSHGRTRWPWLAVPAALVAIAASRSHGPPAAIPAAPSVEAPIVVLAPLPSVSVAPPIASVEPVRPARVMRKPAPSAAPATSARCDPPFVIDPATGTRRVKPGC